MKKELKQISAAVVSNIISTFVIFIGVKQNYHMNDITLYFFASVLTLCYTLTIIGIYNDWYKKRGMVTGK